METQVIENIEIALDEDPRELLEFMRPDLSTPGMDYLWYDSTGD